MSIITPTNFNVQAQTHIDSRLIQADITARNEISTPTRYWGMQVHVLDSDGSNNPNTYILQKGASSTDISDNGNWLDLAGASVGGIDAEVQFNDGGTLGGTSTFYYNKTKDMLVASGSSGLEPDFGAGAHADAGSWSAIFGEEHDFTGGGRPVNGITSGWHHSIGSSATDGAFGGSSFVAFGTDHEIFGRESIAMGFGGAAHGWNSFVVSHHDTNAGGLVTRERVLALGAGSINMSTNTGGQTATHGALATSSAIIGGQNHNIPSDSPRSVILGGNGLKMPAATPDTVMVENLIVNGTAPFWKTSGTTSIDNSAPVKYLREDVATGAFSNFEIGNWEDTNRNSYISFNTGGSVLVTESAGIFSTINVTDGGLSRLDTNVIPSTGTLWARLSITDFNTSDSIQFQLDRSAGAVLTDDLFEGGFQYAADYSTYGAGTIGDRWIPDKGYNDGAYLLNGAITTLTGATTIGSTVGTPYDLTFRNNANDVEYQIGDADFITSFVDGHVWVVSSQALMFSTGTPKGLQYSGDYSGTFDARSLIDKGYADGAYAPIGTGVQTAHIQLAAGDITVLDSVPVQVIGIPGAGKYIQIVSASAYLDFTTGYSLNVGTIDNLKLQYDGSTDVMSTHTTGGNNFITKTSDTIKQLQLADELAGNAPDLKLNTGIYASSESSYTGSGGTIDIYVQYVIIDTN